MKSIGQQRFAPHGMLALQPQAFGMLFAVHESNEEPAVGDNGVAVIDVCGPLMHRKSFWFDSYDEIKSRVAAAINAQARVIMLSVDSPGGLVSGAFDCSRELRAMCDRSGVDLRAHVGGTGASAAYAIASAASWIGVSQTAMVGSVGVIDTIVDATEQNKMAGLNVQLIASGIRKPDGNPDMPITEGAIKAAKARVDELAEMFFALVEENGWAKTEALRSMQGGIVTGEQAVAMGLASEVVTFEQAIAFGVPGAASEATNGDKNMTTPMEDAIESLRKAAESDNEEESSKAKKMLAAMEEEDDSEAEGDEEDKPEAEGEEDESEAEGEEDDSEARARASVKPGASSNDVALQALAEVHRMKAERVKEKRESERAELIASRPDFSEEMVAILQTSPLATVKKMVKDLPAGNPVRKTRKNVAAAATVQGTRGAGTDDRSARSDVETKTRLDAAMGLTDSIKGIKHSGNRMIFGASLPKTSKG